MLSFIRPPMSPVDTKACKLPGLPSPMFKNTMLFNDFTRWLLLAALGWSWLLLAAPGWSWLVLAVPGCSWLVLAAPGSQIEKLMISSSNVEKHNAAQ